MFANRVSVMKAVTRLADKNEPKRRNRDKEEIELLKHTKRTLVNDVGGVWENTTAKLRFRKFPWGHWFLGFLWLAGTIWVIYEIYEDLFAFKSHKILKEYTMLAFSTFMGLIFLWKGKIKHTIFDKKAGSLTIKKRNTCCDKRSIVTYKLKDISDVKAVYRGYKRGTVDTQTYSVIVEMDRFQHQDIDTSDAEEFMSSDDEFDIKKKKMRAEEWRDHFEAQAEAKKAQEDSALIETKDTVDTVEASEEGLTFSESVEQMKKENIANLAKSVEQKKDPYRRGIYKGEDKGLMGLITNRFDKNVKEKHGRKEELKILESRNKKQIMKECILIRKFLRMDCQDVKIIDERETKIQGDKLD